MFEFFFLRFIAFIAIGFFSMSVTWWNDGFLPLLLLACLVGDT